ncbi:MAG: hypothetical protein L3J33_04520 [Rhodobacteraceae bacterium]|nr:hypothetical protein [Paracoccaceae bacterium]
MSDEIPTVAFSQNANGDSIGFIGEKQYEFLTDMLLDGGFLRYPENVGLLAQALNHFDMGRVFSVIEDIDGFTAAFRKTYAEEEEKPFDQYNSSISDFSMPDLDQIKHPAIADDQITFFVKHNGLGIPYRVTGATDGRSKLTYTPL